MTTLEELLLLPRRWGQRDYAWRKLTTDDTFFASVQDAVEQGSIGEAMALLGAWENVVKEDARQQYQWQQLVFLLNLAHLAGLAGRLRDIAPPPEDASLFLLQAVAKEIGVHSDHETDPGTFRMGLATVYDGTMTDKTNEDPAIRGVDRVCTFLAGKISGSSTAMRLSQVWDTLRTLLGTPRQVVCKREIAVAGAEGNRGFLATLVLEVVEPGCGEVFHAPKDALHTHADVDFEVAMRDAWRGARQFLQEQGITTQTLDGRWSLLRNNAHASQANDRSASGAAARGWWYALTQKIPDQGVMVIAQVDEHDVLRLQGVDDDGVFAKTLTIADDGRMDTIVVASESNELRASEALQVKHKLNSLRVLNLASSSEGDAPPQCSPIQPSK